MAAKKSTAKKYIAFHTGCGDANQLSPVKADYGSYIHSTIQAAKDEVKESLEQGNLDEGGFFVIAEIVEVGAPSGVEWGKKADAIGNE